MLSPIWDSNVIISSPSNPQVSLHAGAKQVQDPETMGDYEDLVSLRHSRIFGQVPLQQLGQHAQDLHRIKPAQTSMAGERELPPLPHELLTMENFESQFTLKILPLGS